MLKGKTALVTGSTSGIGLGIAKGLARQGAHVVLNGFGDAQGPCAEVRAAAAQAGHEVRVEYHGADMSRPADIEEMMAFAARELGRVDILVNNAGIQHVASTEDFPVERWDSILAINLSSAFHTTRLALPAMKAANWGRIINVASVHGLVASAQKAAYVAAKHGVVGLTKVVALETATTGVTCNAICPGWVLTPLVQSKWMPRLPPRVSRSRRPRGNCWAKRSRRCSSPHPKNWPNWPCSSAPAPPTTCVVWPGTWMAAGWRSKNLSGNYLVPRWSAIGMSSRSWRVAWAGCPCKRQGREIARFRPNPKGSAFSGGLRRCGACP